MGKSLSVPLAKFVAPPRQKISMKSLLISFSGRRQHVFWIMLGKYDVIVVEAECGLDSLRYSSHLLASPKVRPNLLVSFIADPADSLQIISASERPRGDNARRHHMPDPGHGC